MKGSFMPLLLKGLKRVPGATCLALSREPV